MVGIERVDLVVHGGDIDHVVTAFTGNIDRWNIQRLRVYCAVHVVTKSRPNEDGFTLPDVRTVSRVLAAVVHGS